MVEFTAKDVMALRERTGAGMMDCKKALTEAAGDADRAVDILREKGLAAAAKKAGRIAAEGLVAVAFCNECGAASMVEVNSETDFVAKNPEFVQLVEQAAQAALDPYMDYVLYAAPLFDADVNERLLILDTDIHTYMKSCAAKFIRGEMSFDEWDTYCKTLEGMGLEELVGIYQERLDTYQ